MANKEIREEIKNSGFFKWQIADKIGICEMSLIRWLRTELTEERKERIRAAISLLKVGELNDTTTNENN